MPNRKRITLLSPTTNKELASLICDKLQIVVQSANTVEDIFHDLNDPGYRTDFLCIGIDTLIDKKNGLDMFDILNTLDTLIKATCCVGTDGISAKRCTKVQVLIDENTDICLVKQVMSMPVVSGVGWITKNLNDIDQCMAHVEQMLAGGSGLHLRVQELLRPRKEARAKDEISLTNRQTQVLHLLQDRGASNKVIARLLGVSESTVKLHIGAILKKYGVKNRTQLALFSQSKER